MKYIVFFTGACVLVIEVLAVRILAPYFGSTLPALSSVIGVTLGALSIGYRLGGGISDKPLWFRFFAIISLSGISVLLLWPLATGLLPVLSTITNPVLGPLLASIILFALPCTLLGMLSPYAIALSQASSSDGAGRIAGVIFFWSTLGSIAGSFLTGFVLIPTFGVLTVLFIVGVSLLLVGFIGLSVSRRNKALQYAGVFILLTLTTLMLAPVKRDEVFAKDGVYQRIAVEDHILSGNAVRLLRQDRNISSGVFPRRSDHVFEYTRVPAVAWTGRSPPVKSLVIGAGAYVIPRAIAAETSAEVDVVDIEPGLDDIAKEYFDFVPTDYVRTIVADGRHFLRGAGEYDLIVADAYQAVYAIPTHLTTREFFQLVREHLTDDGIFVGNFLGSIAADRPNYLPSAARTLLTVFPNGKFFAMRDPKSSKVQNIVFVGCRADTCIDPCSSQLRASSDVILRSLCEREVRFLPAQLEHHILLTDDYAPVEFLNASAAALLSS